MVNAAFLIFALVSALFTVVKIRTLATKSSSDKIWKCARDVVLASTVTMAFAAAAYVT